MITRKEIFDNAQFDYSKIKEQVDKYINHGLEAFGGAKVEFRELDAGVVHGDDEGAVRYRKGVCGVNFRYMDDIIKEVEAAGLSYHIVRSDDYWQGPKYLMIYV